MKREYGRERRYSKDFPGRNDIVIWDVLKIEKEQILKLTLISKNSPYNQGVRLAIDAGKGYIECQGRRGKEWHIMWDEAPSETYLKVNSKEGLVSVFNMYQEKDGIERFHSYHGGMILEEEGNKTTYHCNDYGETDKFDKLVFSVEKLSPHISN